MLTDGRFLDAVRLLQFLHHLAVAACRQTMDHLLPDRVLHERGLLQQLVAAQRNFPLSGVPHSRPLQGDLLSTDDAIARFAAPAHVGPFGIGLILWSY